MFTYIFIGVSLNMYQHMFMSFQILVRQVILHTGWPVYTRTKTLSVFVRRLFFNFWKKFGVSRFGLNCMKLCPQLNLLM